MSTTHHNPMEGQRPLVSTKHQPKINFNMKHLSRDKNEVHEYNLVSQDDEAKDKVRRINRCMTIIERQSSEQSETSYGQPDGVGADDPFLQQCVSRRETASIRSMFDKSHPRFGPIYGEDQAFVLDMKKAAWQHVKRKSGHEDLGLTKESYSAAIRRVEKEVREAYGDQLSSIRSSKFRLMMIRDGCFFLQLAFLILGKSKHLGYPEKDPIFSRKPHRKDINKWMEAMFFVGNQIPTVVLKELVKEKFFQDVIEQANLVQTQSGLCKKLLYELLVSPKQNISWFDSWRTRTVRLEPQPSDLLHSLHNMLLGPDHNHLALEVDEDLDLEANYEQGISMQDRIFPRMSNSEGENANSSDPFRNFFRAMENAFDHSRRIFPCAVDLMQSGIHIKKLKTGGIKSIRLENHYLWANLYLPALPVDDDLEIIFNNLITYERNQKIEKHSRQVSSYILFLKDIVQTTQDVKLLRKKGVIEGSSEYAEKLPGILRRLGSEDIALTPEFRRVKRMIRDYSSPWIHYRGILNFVAFLALLQTVFTLLAYYKPPGP